MNKKKYTKEQEEEYAIINDTLMYLWNVDFYTFIETLFEKKWSSLQRYEQEYYLDKYMKVKAHNPAGIWSLLDKDKQMRLMKITSEHYGKRRE